MTSILATLLVAVPGSAFGAVCWIEDVATPVSYLETDTSYDSTAISPTRTQILICRGGSYGESNASQPPASGEYLDVAQSRVMEYDAESETMSDAGEPLPSEHREEQTGQCRYLGGEWDSGGIYTYGHCFSLSVGEDRTLSYRLSAREINGPVLTAKVQLHFRRADHSPAGPDKEIQGVICAPQSRAGVSITNCDLQDSRTLPRSDIPPDAAYYCGIGRLYKTVGGQSSEAEAPIFAPCHRVPPM